MKIIIIACIFVAVAAQELLKPAPCPKNEVYSQCGANGCQNTCDNPTFSLVCKAMCMAGCICRDGYLRDSNGICILAKDCPIKCKGLEIFSDCAPNTCKKTCDTLNTACRAPCVPGCKCPNNYVYSDKTKTKCIPIKQCPQSACKKANESYTSCGTACPPTCENPTPGICTKQCVAGCFCNAGYVRSSNGDCVLVADCPKPICKKFEIFSDCAPEACKKTCDTLNTACRAPCVPGCKCPENQVYRDDNRDACILEEECPQITV